MLYNREDDPEKRVKLLSLKLLQASTSSEVVSLFDEKYVKNLIEKIYAEELCLFLYFYVSLKEKEVMNESIELKDSRLEILLNRINEQINEMDFTNILILSWSTSILVSKFKLVIPIE